MRVIIVLALVVLSQGDGWVAFFDSLHKVIEHGLGHVLGVWIGAIIGATSLLAARPAWRMIRRYMGAATIRKSAGRAFVICAALS